MIKNIVRSASPIASTFSECWSSRIVRGERRPQNEEGLRADLIQEGQYFVSMELRDMLGDRAD